MAFFDFLRELGYDEPNVARINLRYKHIVAPHRRDFEGARVLDLGSHDGRWGTRSPRRAPPPCSELRAGAS